MKLAPGGFVDAHFDMSNYWDTRVRLHIPVRTNRHVIFSCGQRDEVHKLNMKRGKVYLFDNHLGHSVKNGGKSPRIHLVLDMVGTRKFWDLVAHGRQIGSTPKRASSTAHTVVEDKEAQIAIETWRDADLKRNCSALVAAMASTAAQLNLEAEGR